MRFGCRSGGSLTRPARTTTPTDIRLSTLCGRAVVSLLRDLTLQVFETLALGAGKNVISRMRTPAIERELQQACEKAIKEAVTVAAPAADASVRELIELVCIEFFKETGVPEWIVVPGLDDHRSSRSVSLERWASRFHSRLPRDSTFDEIDVDSAVFATAFGSALWKALIEQALVPGSALRPVIDQLRLGFIEGRLEDIAESLTRRLVPAEPITASYEEFEVNSSARTKVLLEAVPARHAQRPEYHPPERATEQLAAYLESPSRVYLTKGPPGCGKTRLAYHVAQQLAGSVTFQLHSVDSWDSPRADLATDVLRYASLSYGDDALLTLERICAGFRRTCIVVIDGIKSQGQFDEVARQVDRVLRQVTSQALRFFLIVRTPPDVEMSPYPVLAASVYEPPASSIRGYSYRLTPWGASEAKQVWNESREFGEPAFTELPLPVQQLARLPLYMRLLKTAGTVSGHGGTNAYRLVDHCVSAVLRAAGRDVEHISEELADAAHGENPHVMPPQLGHLVLRHSSAPSTATLDVRPLVWLSAAGHLVFDHDVIREYFLATRIANVVAEHGRSAATVQAFNDLAERASISAMDRGVFDFVVFCLDQSAPDILASVALSPAVNVHSTLPLMLNLVTGGARFATDEVLRISARRCTRDSAVELATSLLATPAVANALLGDYATWLIDLLRTFGSAVWSGMISAVERTLDPQIPQRLLEAADLKKADEATFFARHFFLFVGDNQTSAGPLEILLEHVDWRVRAALADGVRDQRSPSMLVAQWIMDRLAHDADYKVRAAVARAIGGSQPGPAMRYLKTFLTDDNWHVRACLLQAIMSGGAESFDQNRAVNFAVDLIRSEASWRHCPAHVATLKERLLLLHGTPSTSHQSYTRRRALFALLREARTGWTRLPSEIQDALVAEGHRSSDWLVQREAAALRKARPLAKEPVLPLDAPSLRDAYRRLRNRRSVQIALDLHDLDQAIAVAKAAAATGIDFIEVGDPLLKAVGINAVEQIKRNVPQVAVVAEMMSADWGRDQVVLAAETGADVVFLIGPATAASVAAATDAGRRLGVPILLDVPARHASEHWIRDMEHAGVDGFAITTNIDIGVGGRHPLAQARAIRNWTRLPVAVSGGFSTTDHAIIGSADWDILIVGRGVTEAVQPTGAARELFNIVHRVGVRRANAHDDA